MGQITKLAGRYFTDRVVSSSATWDTPGDVAAACGVHRVQRAAAAGCGGVAARPLVGLCPALQRPDRDGEPLGEDVDVGSGVTGLERWCRLVRVGGRHRWRLERRAGVDDAASQVGRLSQVRRYLVG